MKQITTVAIMAGITTRKRTGTDTKGPLGAEFEGFVGSLM